VDPAIRDRRAFIDRFARACSADDRVVAAFLSGSYAAGTPDRYSDVDLLVVAAHGAYERLFEERWRIMAQLGELVLAEDFRGFGRDMLLYLYADGVDGEVDLHRRDSASWVDPSRLQPLVDKDHVAAELRAWPTAPAADRQRRAEQLVRQFWRQVWLGAAAVARGRLLTAHGSLEAARVCCVNAARLGHDLTSPWSLSGYEKAESVLAASEQTALGRTFVPLEARALSGALGELAELFGSLTRELARRHEITVPAGLADVVERRLREIGRT
jgi:predicted nucleotidyltransferase